VRSLLPAVFSHVSWSTAPEEGPCYPSFVEAAKKIPLPSAYIEATDGACGGKPRIAGTRIKVSEVARRHAYQEQSPDEIIEAFPHLSLAQVHAALAYYYDHHDDIEAELRADDEFVTEMARRYAPNLLQK